MKFDFKKIIFEKKFYNYVIEIELFIIIIYLFILFPILLLAFDDVDVVIEKFTKIIAYNHNMIVMVMIINQIANGREKKRNEKKSYINIEQFAMKRIAKL